MSGTKETPRQKMIGMMYLFYTALLALNVSSDILNAFVLVNDSMSQTNENFGAKNGLLMNSFANQYQLNPAKVKPYYDQAVQIQHLSDELVSYLRKVQDTIIILNEFGGEPGDVYISKTEFRYELERDDGTPYDTVFDRAYKIPTGYFKLKDKYHVPMHILKPEQKDDGKREAGSDGIVEGDGEALILKKKFANYNNAVLSILDPKDAATIKLGLNTDDVYNSVAREQQPWQYNNFYHTVIVADLVILKKYVSEVLNTEAEVIAKLYGYIDAASMKFDTIRAVVVPRSNVVISGAEYEADIFVAAYNKTDNPYVNIKKQADTLTMAEIPANGNGEGFVFIDTASDGIIKYRFNTSTTGDFKYAGFINVKGPDGKPKPYFFNSAYQVIKPTATVSATKMNVVYRGLDNPISVSASGFTNDRIKVSVSGGGRLSPKGNGTFVFIPPKGGVRKVTFNVSGLKEDGTTVALGKQEFRVMGVPAALIKVAGKNEGKISAALISSQPILTATMANFAFDLSYRVVSYDIMVFSSRGERIIGESVKSNRISNAAIKKIKKAPRGSVINILNVKIKGPDGVKRALGFTLKLQ